MKKIIYLFVCFVFFILSFSSALAEVSLSKGTLSASTLGASDLSTWTFNFTVPEKITVGHFLISLGGYPPDLSQAKLSVSGLPGGVSSVGKTNPSCVSNCDDIRYILAKTASLSAGSKITIIISDVKNPKQAGETGIKFINLYSSLYPQTELAASGQDYFVKTSASPTNPTVEDLLADKLQTKIQDVLINELFYQKGAKTTKLNTITDPTRVENFTLDLLDKVKVQFKEPIDLSSEDSVRLIAGLADHMSFEYLNFWVDEQLTSYFKVPLEITFYNIPFVWEPDIIKDDQFILDKTMIEGFKALSFDNQQQILMIIRDSGGYRVIAHLQLYIEDNQNIPDNNYPAFTGRISDPEALLKVSLNGKELKDLNLQIDAATGDFSFRPELVPGSNLIEVTAESQFGKIAKITKIVQLNTQNSTAQNKSYFTSPLYFALAGLAVLALLLIFVIRYLVKSR